MDDIIQGIRVLLTGFLLTQLSYGFTIFLLEGTMTSFYALVIYEKPSSSYQKFVNLFMFLLVGSGYYIYLRLRKYNWFVRKFLFLIALVLQGIASVIIYYSIYGSLKAIFHT
ncbi:hypothetical protein ACQKL0_14175 [Peribacillus sp. NPDC097264]|uniref:hypothetical protein n=1 Tax=Peribacillus sp. NPDC097264 TaxID=3390616 RepID=UPI003CFD5E47